jgi:nitrate reductase NapAB chaperone NapD
MKITFNDKSSIECYKSDEPGKIVIAITARDHENPLKKITNSCEMTVDEFKLLVGGILT